VIEIPDDIGEFWRAFEAVVGHVAPDRLYEVFHFDDNEPTANELAELVVNGPKRATAGLVWSFEAKGRPAPRPGDLSVVTDWAGRPRCVIETTAVEVRPFADVDDAFAAAEGEGDGSLRWWRDALATFLPRVPAPGPGAQPPDAGGVRALRPRLSGSAAWPPAVCRWSRCGRRSPLSWRRENPMPEYIPSPRQWVRDQVKLYEKSGGKEGTTLRDTGLPVIIVTHRGNKTGAIRKTPLMKVKDGVSYVLVGSVGGAQNNPVWVHNLRANPAVEIRDLTAVQPMKVREVQDPTERARLWTLAVAAYPPYEEDQAKTSRQIPLFVAEP
jgi:deazaflavin-dependent oxidoreductase (nitroreductase family)